MSRIGHDYLKVGQFMELLRQKGVRLIAINDNVDSFYKEDDFTPFRNIMNEWYARDTSRKIKSTFKVKGESGKPTASTAPYGYLKDPNDNNKWIVDKVAAKIVKRIFDLTIQGAGPYRIARILEEEQVPIPALHQQRLGVGLYKTTQLNYPYRWCSSTIAHILKRQEYLGHTVNFKTRKHFKDKKSKYVSEDKWLIFENTHEAIIDQETFNNVQRTRGNVKRYPNGWGEFHSLSGLLYCSYCGSIMYVHRTNNYKNIPYYTCSAYSKVPCGTKCSTAHRIKAENVLELIKQILEDIKKQIEVDKDEFILSVTDEMKEKEQEEIEYNLAREKECKDRVKTLEKLMCRIYEDMILEKIPNTRYEVLNAQYEDEQLKLTEELKEIEKKIKRYNTEKDGINKFIKLIGKYDTFEELTTYMINEFIEKVVVYERENKGSPTSPQQVDIYFNFIGNYRPPQEELSEEEKQILAEEERKREERRIKLHNNYLKRKANGKQKEYEERYKAKREQLKQEKLKTLKKSGIKVSELKEMEKKQNEMARV